MERKVVRVVAPGDGPALVEELRIRGLARIPFPAARVTAALDDARTFFALPAGAKERLAIERSEHHRGYSEMRSERDWREQIHFGRERPPGGTSPAFRRLEGPNLWPEDTAWRDRLLALLARLESAGREVLAAIARALGVAPLLDPEEDAYLLLKLIRYLPVPGTAPRNGVAPHVDFSWITLVIADAPGLEVRTTDGAWNEVPPVPGTLVVHAGEVLDAATGGLLPATPHRVVLPPGSGARISMPFFLNPDLSTEVRLPHARDGRPRDTDRGGHVHRVLPDGATGSFRFGEAEWGRKGLGVWCAECVG